MQQFCRVNCQPETDLLHLQEINAVKGYYQVFYGFSSNIDENFVQELRKSLNPSELERSERYRFQRDKLNYIACRAITRNVLASHLNCHPAMVDLRFSVNDKPFVPGNSLHFNIAHSREMFAVAFSHQGETGIDIEFVNRDLDFEKIMENYFSENEHKSILASGDNARKKFFLYWTRKEALLKAMGLGITQDLTKIEITDGENQVTISNAGTSIEKEYLVFTTIIGDYYLSLAQSTATAISITEFNQNTMIVGSGQSALLR